MVMASAALALAFGASEVAATVGNGEGGGVLGHPTIVYNINLCFDIVKI